MNLEEVLQEKDIPESDVREHQEALTEHLERSFENVTVTPVPDEGVTARGPAGGKAGDIADEVSMFFRVRITPSSSDEPLESPRDYRGQLEDQLLSAERNCREIRDTQIQLSDHDPEHLAHRSFYFYVYTVF